MTYEVIDCPACGDTVTASELDENLTPAMLELNARRTATDPLKFTHEDVYLLSALAGDAADDEELLAARRLQAKIAALLPPPP